MGNDLRSWPNVKVLRIEFTADDIARTRIATTESSFAETLFGLGALRMSSPDGIAMPWRRDRDRITAELAPFIAPCTTVQADLFTPTGAASEFGEAADRLLGMPDAMFHAELSVTHCRAKYIPPWLDGIDRGGPATRRRLVGAIARVHKRLVDPYWASMRSVIEAERVRLQRALVEGGVDRLLSTFHPLARWRDGVLELPTAGRWSSHALTARLGGAGLVVSPSVLCPVGPVPFFPFAQDGPAMLFYPVTPSSMTRADLWVRSDADTDSPALATLLGRTRAAALEVIADGCTTTELAKRLGISAATASQHASALRGAGLVTSRRDANRMLHAVTGLGSQLLAARTPGPV